MSESSQTGLWAVVLRELERFRSRWIYLMLTLVLPGTAFLFLAFIFQQGMPRDLPIAVSDADHSAKSRLLVRMIESAPSLRVAEEVADAGAGKQAMIRGEAYAVVLIPEHFERDLTAGRSPRITAYYNNQFMLPGSLINRDLTSVVSSLSAGANIRARQARGESADAARTHVQPVYADTHVLFNPYTSYLYYLVPGLLPSVLQLVVMLTTVFSVGIELKEGTAGEWLSRAGGRAWKAVAGKLLPYTLVFTVAALFMNAIVYGWLGVPLYDAAPWVYAGTFALILAYQSIGLVLSAACANLRMAASITAVYAAPAFAFVGVTFPMYAMPPLGRLWAASLPITYYLEIVSDQTLRGAPPEISTTPLAVLFGAGLLGPVLVLPRMRRIMRDARYWGRL